MTEVRMDWNRMRIEFKGHAEAGEYGRDLVCAAVSILVQTLARTLQRAEQRGRTKFGADVQEKGPDKDMIKALWADPAIGNRMEIKSYFRFCVNGMRLLAEEYPRNVKVTEVG